MIVALGERNTIGGYERHTLLLTPEPCPLDVNDDGNIDEYDAAAIYSLLILYEPEEPIPCPEARICDWDVNFDCHITEDDYDAVLDYIANCETEPCLCEGGGQYAATPGGGLSIERYTLALAALDPSLTAEETAVAWEWFFEVYYQYH